ncbi:MAG: DUF2117 domain-containing protein, partial [Archaeoglobaceae archaeon]
KVKGALEWLLLIILAIWFTDLPAIARKRFALAMTRLRLQAYRFAGNCEEAVCIGDDTTAIASEILFRFGTPVLGIVDGDRDFISQVKNIHSDSEIFVTKHDDLAGKIIFEEVFCEKEILEENFTSLKDKIAKILQSKDLLLSRKAMKDFI